jgi:hypothetical protein
LEPSSSFLIYPTFLLCFSFFLSCIYRQGFTVAVNRRRSSPWFYLFILDTLFLISERPFFIYLFLPPHSLNAYLPPFPTSFVNARQRHPFNVAYFEYRAQVA